MFVAQDLLESLHFGLQLYVRLRRIERVSLKCPFRTKRRLQLLWECLHGGVKIRPASRNYNNT